MIKYVVRSCYFSHHFPQQLKKNMGEKTQLHGAQLLVKIWIKCSISVLLQKCLCLRKCKALAHRIRASGTDWDS